MAKPDTESKWPFETQIFCFGFFEGGSKYVLFFLCYYFCLIHFTFCSLAPSHNTSPFPCSTEKVCAPMCTPYSNWAHQVSGKLGQKWRKHQKIGCRPRAYHVLDLIQSTATTNPPQLWFITLGWHKSKLIRSIKNGGEAQEVQSLTLNLWLLTG